MKSDAYSTLLELGRHDLATLLDALCHRLSTGTIRLPDPDLPDHLYFDHAARILQSQGLRLWLPPTLPEPAPTPTPSPRYSLRKGLGVWRLTFDGREAALKHEKGILYVAYLLYHPPEQPIHALDLAARIPEIYRQQLGLPQIADSLTGKSATPSSHARIQERSLALDDAETMRALLRKERELEVILDDENESEPVKAEALRELEQIAEFQRQHGRKSQDSAQRAVRTVRMAITRLHEHLLAAIDTKGNPNSVLRSFAIHLEKHVLIPSARHSCPAGTHARSHLAGCFTYEPPPGFAWAD